MKWSWRWLPPGGIADTAHFGDNPFFDWVRVLCVVISVVLAFVVLRVIIEQQRRPNPMPLHQVVRFVFIILATLSISLTEMAVVGTPATPRLLVNLACLLSGVYGTWGMRVHQKTLPVIK